MGDPFRERRYSAAEVRRVLRRAAELAEEDPRTPEYERSLTRDEIERAAGELGLPAGAVALAIGAPAPDDEKRRTPRAERSSFVGAPTRILLEAEVPGEPSEIDREDIVEDIRRVLGETGTIERVGRSFGWSVNPGYRGRGRDVSVRLRSRGGKTRIVVEERLSRQATGLFVGLGVGAGVAPMGGYIAAIVKLGAIGVLFPLLWIPMMLLLARTIFGALARRRERALAQLMARLESGAAGWTASDAGEGVRVSASADAAVTEDGDEDDVGGEARRRGRA